MSREIKGFIKWAIGTAALCAVAYLALSYSPLFYSEDDPYALYRWAVQTIIAIVAFSVGLTGLLQWWRWYTGVDWYEELGKGNWNVTAVLITVICAAAYLLGGLNR